MFIVPHSLLMSASTDKTGAVWDVEVGQRVKKLKGHTSFVNSCCASRRGPQLAVTGSDDGTVKVRGLLFNLYSSVLMGTLGFSLCLHCYHVARDYISKFVE